MAAKRRGQAIDHRQKERVSRASERASVGSVVLSHRLLQRTGESGAHEELRRAKRESEKRARAIKSKSEQGRARQKKRRERTSNLVDRGGGGDIGSHLFFPLPLCAVLHDECRLRSNGMRLVRRHTLPRGEGRQCFRFHQQRQRHEV